MAGSAPGRAAGARTSLGVLGERNFALFFTGYATSLLGSAMVPIALTYAVLDRGYGASAVGDVLAAQTVPLIVLLLVGGVLADRIPRRVTMLGADLVRAASEGALAALLIAGSPTLWEIMVLAGVLGAAQAFFNPALTGLLPEIVPADRLQAANALRGVAASSGRLLGPSLAGVIVAAGGSGWAVAIDAATYVVSAASLWRLRLPAQLPAVRSSIIAELAGGWQEFRSRTWLWVIVAQFATYNALCFAPFVVLGAVVTRHGHGGAAAWGAILAAFGAGSVLGGLGATRTRVDRPLVVAVAGAAVLAAPIALLALPAPTVVIAVAAGVAGIGLATFDAQWETSLQREVPSEALSRVSSYDWLGSLAFVPVGYLIAGPLASLLGVRATLVASAGWAVASCAAALATRSVRGLRSPAPAPAPALG